MFHKSPDERLSVWSEFRKDLDTLDDPLTSLVEFWSTAPKIIHNHKIDPYNPKSWPTPWELIVENKYDDFTLALMMAYTLKLTKKHNNDKIEVRTMVDSAKTKLYNLVYVNDENVLNYLPNSAAKAEDIDSSLYLENIINIVFPR
jgi:hypothetical protein